MSKLLIHIDVRTYNKTFIAINSETCSISYMYLWQLHRFLTRRTWRLVIVLGQKDVDCKGEVYTVYRPFDFAHYFALDNYQKKKTILDLIHTTMLEFSKSEAEEFDAEKLQAAYNYCLNHNLECRYCTPYKRSPNHRYYGAVEFLWEVDFCQATAIIADKNKQEIGRKQLFTHHAGWFTYSKEKIGWGSPTCFYLESVDHFTGERFETTPQRWHAEITEGGIV